MRQYTVTYFIMEEDGEVEIFEPDDEFNWELVSTCIGGNIFYCTWRRIS